MAKERFFVEREYTCNLGMIQNGYEDVIDLQKWDSMWYSKHPFKSALI